MSKIGRKPIDLGNVKIEIKGNDIHYTGKERSGIYTLPGSLKASVDNNKLYLTQNKDGLTRNQLRESNRIWGLHRALLANTIKGADHKFEKKLEINGLGYKAVMSGDKITFSLGYSHKIDFTLPQGVSLEIDKTGQKLTFKSAYKDLLGLVCSKIRAFRPPEPYKGTGIKLANETIMRKAGKTKA